MGAKIDQKSIKKGIQHGKASWHRFLSDFNGSWGRTWGGKSSQDRPRQGKTREDKGREGKGEERKREAGIGKEKRSRGTFSARGGWVHPPFRGRPPQGPGPCPAQDVGTSYFDVVAFLAPSFFRSFFRCLFGSILLPFSFPTCLPKSTKIHQKSMPRCLPMLTSFFDSFLMGFCSQLRPPEPHGSSPRCSESTIYQKIAFRILH